MKRRYNIRIKSHPVEIKVIDNSVVIEDPIVLGGFTLDKKLSKAIIKNLEWTINYIEGVNDLDEDAKRFRGLVEWVPARSDFEDSKVTVSCRDGVYTVVGEGISSTSSNPEESFSSWLEARSWREKEK